MSSEILPAPLTTTSFAILGLLAIQPWTTYELAQQMERTLNRMWPRARSKLYEEPKKLVAHGLAVASSEQIGKRPRTVYSITRAGRRALVEWLRTPGAGPVLEFEQLTKLFFADHGRKQDALATLDATSAWAAEQLAVFAEAASEYLEGRGGFPERIATTVLSARFEVDFYLATQRWAQWGAPSLSSGRTTRPRLRRGGDTRGHLVRAAAVASCRLPADRLTGAPLLRRHTNPAVDADRLGVEIRTGHALEPRPTPAPPGDRVAGGTARPSAGWP